MHLALLAHSSPSYLASCTSPSSTTAPSNGPRQHQPSGPHYRRSTPAAYALKSGGGRCQDVIRWTRDQNYCGITNRPELNNMG